ncbi:hypothetical protein O2N63_00605 [Aliiroseovarius sp. KMU-50]|uniref:Lipoprotein n=1 Tax=Aliiroseovarius salicola TaxID=3009082 RepID=A0ABT4VWF8_9RHOB|nr:hypothetical protein [Aliiroseovarius sp. KMU-50]MDA5092588.1 hypothetical protein [Aliiroseovarius sp. KMU-50]
MSRRALGDTDMKKPLLGCVLILGLAACQTTTQSQIATPVPAGCDPQVAAHLATLGKEIKTLEARQERGYRTNNSVVQIANPLNLCASPLPFVSVCAPSPEIRSTLPSYHEHKAERARLEDLKSERKALEDANKACQ